jgi:hypothetical protein
MEAVSIAYFDEETFMQVQTVLPASAVVPAVPVQIASTPTAQAPPAQPAHTVQAAPPVPTTSHAPVCPIPPVLPAEATQMGRPSKPTVPAPPAPAVSEHSAPVGSVTTVEKPSVESTPEEVQLTQEIDQLWNAHSRAQGSLRKSREDAAKIRADLSVRLHQLKKVLSRPGRGGAWFVYLRRATLTYGSGAKEFLFDVSHEIGDCVSFAIEGSGANRFYEPVVFISSWVLIHDESGTVKRVFRSIGSCDQRSKCACSVCRSVELLQSRSHASNCVLGGVERCY